MTGKRMTSLLSGLLILGAAVNAAAAPWICTLPDSVALVAGPVTLQDIAVDPIPAYAGRVSLLADPQPGTMSTLERNTILRRLVELGAAGGVRFRGARNTVITFSGRVVDASELIHGMEAELKPWLPAAESGAPATWLEVKYQGRDRGCAGDCSPILQGASPLRAGRQTVRFRVGDAVVPVGIVVHHFAWAARTRSRITRGANLHDTDLAWEWVDLADEADGRLIGRRSVSGYEAARTLEADSELLEQDLELPPVILAGDPVELRLARGGVQVSVRAYARRAGSTGQTIPVRNELTGKLINARIIGPGTVEWRY